MMVRLLLFAGVAFGFVGMVNGADYRVEKLAEAAPADDLSDELAATLADEGFRVVRGSNRTVCEIWPCKEWMVKPGFKPTSELLYPFKPGQLVGVLRFKRRGSDFREQQISRGVYTLRFGMQPVDGNHEGTSPTRDFLLLASAESDASPEVMDVKKLLELSAEAAGSNHPAMLCLQKVQDADGESPRLRHDEQRDWWMLQFQNTALAGDEKLSLPMEVVVVGHAEE